MTSTATTQDGPSVENNSAGNDSQSVSQIQLQSQLQATTTNNRYPSIYQGSIYRDLLFFRETKSYDGLIIGIVVILMQLFLYFELLPTAQDNITSPQYNIVGSDSVCDDDGDLYVNSFSELECATNGGFQGSFISISALPMLISVFTFVDVLSSLKILCIRDSSTFGIFEKVVALAVLLVQCVALYVAALFAYGGIAIGSTLTAVSHCVIVLFINYSDKVIARALDGYNGSINNGGSINGGARGDDEKEARAGDIICGVCCQSNTCCMANAVLLLFGLWCSVCFVVMIVAGSSSYEEDDDTFDSDSYYTSSGSQS